MTLHQLNNCLGCAVLMPLLSGFNDGNELCVEEGSHLSPLLHHITAARFALPRKSVLPDTSPQCWGCQEIILKLLLLFLFSFFLCGFLIFQIRGRRERHVYLHKQLKATLNSVEFFSIGKHMFIVLFPFIFRMLTCQLILTGGSNENLSGILQ